MNVCILSDTGKSLDVSIPPLNVPASLIMPNKFGDLRFVNKDRIEDILYTLNDACIALDKSWQIVYANAETERLIGIPLSELIGHNLWEKWPYIHGTLIEEELRKVVDNHQASQFEFEYFYSNSSIPSWIKMYVYPSADGGINLFTRNITDLKRSEIKSAGNLLRDLMIKKIFETAIRSDDVQPVLMIALKGLGESLNLDRCYYVMHDTMRGTGTIICEWMREGLPPIAGEYQLSEYADDCSAVYKLDLDQVVNDINDPRLQQKVGVPLRLINALGLTAMVRTPLSTCSTITAQVAAMTTGARNWTKEEIALIQAVAIEIADVLQSLYTQAKHRRIATVLQDALQPAVSEEVPGLEIDVFLKPALDEANVGGDFYDIFHIKESKYAFVIGDVSGKGIDAAAQVSTVRNMLRTYLYQGLSPKKAALSLNEVVTSHELLLGFVTIFIGVYDCDTGQLRYTSCGHELPIILRRNTNRTFKTCGPPVGAEKYAEYTEDLAILESGDILIMYTDGLSEAGPNRRDLLGPDGLAEIVRNRLAEGSQLNSQNVVADVERYANGRLRDDACLVIAKIIGTQKYDIESVNMHGYIDQTHSSNKPISNVQQKGLSDKSIEQQFRLLVENVAEYAIFLLDTKGYIVTWNRGAERIKGYSANEIIGKHFSIFYTTEDIQRGHPRDELEIAAGEGRYEEEGWRLRKDGTKFWANVVITALYDEGGQLCGYGKVTRDFTERRRTEQQLRRSEERFRLLVQGVRDYAIFMMDQNGFIINWNEGAQRIKGYRAEEIVGQHFSKFYTQQDKEAGKPDHELVITAAEGRYEEEGWRVRKDGTYFWASVIITSLRDDNGNLYGFAKVTRDITDRKRADELKIQNMRDQISRSFLRDILYSVTEGRLRSCETKSELPPKLPCYINDASFSREDLGGVRISVHDAALRCQFPDNRTGDLITAVSEAAMNAVIHAEQSTYSVCGNNNTMQVWISDNGTGIELTQLHRATLERGFTTEGSLGHGFWLMLHTCDRLWLYSSSTGTIVVLEQDAYIPEPDWFSHPREYQNYFSVNNDVLS